MRAGIVGGGILGRLIAFVLQQRHWEVTLFDHNKDTCSLAAAGLLTPISELEKSDITIFQLGIDALKEHWPALLAQLAEPIYFRHKGSLVVAHLQDETELTHAMHLIAHKLNSTQFFDCLTPGKITALEPDLTLNCKAYYFADEGQIDSQHLLQVLTKTLLPKINYLDKHYVDLVKPGEIVTSHVTYSFDTVFDCRGLGAKSILSNLRGVRGELIWLYAPEISIHRPIRLLHPRYRLYIVPRPEHIYLLGSTEIESEDNSAISVRTTLELLTAAYSLQAKFSEARLIKTVTACRPTFINHLPKIYYSPGLFIINGLYRHGFLIAPSLVYELLRFIEQGRTAIHYPHLWESL
jgi:glycine oxidase